MRWLDGIINLIDMSLSKLAVDDEQGGLACCDSWGRKESDTTEPLNRTDTLLVCLYFNVPVGHLYVFFTI